VAYNLTIDHLRKWRTTSPSTICVRSSWIPSRCTARPPR
jgi:hypothetical protein